MPYSADTERRRPPIGAMFTGPGPAAYARPSCVGAIGHDFSRKKAPGYSMGGRHSMWNNTQKSPGPQYNLTKNLTRKGGDGTPCYSFGSRNRTPKSATLPGPAHYAPERYINPKFRNSSQYSMGARTGYHKKDNTPGPDTYKLPDVTGANVVNKKSAPAFSMRPKATIGSFHEDLQKTPGPGTYNTINPNNYKLKMPMFSMTSRNTMPGDSTRKPGPETYHPHDSNRTKKAAPSFSFGVLHSQYKAPLIAEPID